MWRVTQREIILAGLFFLMAALYSSVGHAGASGYLAAMALLSVAPPIMKPTALVLNILVASVGSIRYLRAGCFRWSTAWPFLLGAVPLAWVGGAMPAHGYLFKCLVAVVLALSAVKLMDWQRRKQPENPLRPLNVPLAIGAGGGIGLLAGLTGTGGGIFLSPLLLLTRWADMRHTLGITSVFILGNSIAGLLGNTLSLRSLPSALWLWALAAGLGGLLGSYLGSRVFPPGFTRWLLALVLLIASAKLALSY